MRNRNTIEFLGIWERLMNPNFNCAEFDIIKSQAGLNRFRLSAKVWTEKTNAIGIQLRRNENNEDLENRLCNSRPRDSLIIYFVDFPLHRASQFFILHSSFFIYFVTVLQCYS